MYLALNTASQPNRLSLFTKEKVIANLSWRTHATEAKKLFVALQKFINAHHLNLQTLHGICVVNGPGSFSAVRVGVVTANVIATLLAIPLFPIDLPTLHKLQTNEHNSFGETMQRWLSTSPKSEKIVKPLYSAPPNITHSKTCEGISFTQ